VDVTPVCLSNSAGTISYLERGHSPYNVLAMETDAEQYELLDIVAMILRPIAARQHKATAKAQHCQMMYKTPRHSLVRIEPFYMSVLREIV
jgi:hypothetical protein